MAKAVNPESLKRLKEMNADALHAKVEGMERSIEAMQEFFGKFTTLETGFNILQFTSLIEREYFLLAAAFFSVSMCSICKSKRQ